MSERLDSQDPALSLLGKMLGYTCMRGSELGHERDSEAEPWLTRRLEAALRRINPGLSTQGAKQAMASLRQPVGSGLLEANEASHSLLSRWVSVEEAAPAPGQPPMRRSVQFFDFENPTNNDFLAVDEFSVRGSQGVSRFDIVLFVNGLPLVIIECKDPADKKAMTHAITDLQNYQTPGSGVPRFFHTAHFCLALSKNQARFGTVTTPLNHYSQWKSLRPFTKNELEKKLARPLSPQDLTLASLCHRNQLLDFLRSFTAFERQGGRVIKKLARYQQWEAVRDSADRLQDKSRGPLTKRGGVVWHTQGSGKSLTMLWLALRLRRAKPLENPTLLIVTDRTGLDRQITKTFQNCGFENPIPAKSGKHLQELLDGASGKTILTTIQKFQDDLTGRNKNLVFAKDENVIILIDEAHRTEYGVFNARLRQALPHASLIAFTGTPIPKTVAKFGSYIHKYTMPQSVEDEATVPILYESRLPQLAVWGKRLDPLFEAEFPDLTDEQKEEIKKREVTARKIAEAPDRIEMIALDIAKHYQENFESDGFKAQVAACSQRAAAAYYETLSRLFPNRVALVLSDPAKDQKDLWELRKQFADEEEIIRQFTDDGVDRLAIIIVVDKYLTGFDAPIERVLYLDKSLQEHNLLQAIARVNRPLPEKDKQWGLVVDYWGVAGFLDRALKGLHEDLDPGDVMARRDDDTAHSALRARRSDVCTLFPTDLKRDDITPWLEALEPEDQRALFLARYRSFYKALEQLLPDPRALSFLADFAWLRKIRLELQTFFEEEDLSLPDCSERVRRLIEKSIQGEEIIPLLKPISILSKDFDKELEKLTSDRAKALRMRHAIKHTITVKLHEDPVYYETLQERLERIIAERTASRFDDIAEFKLLTDLAEEMRTRNEAERNNDVSAELAPFFNAISKATDEDIDGTCVAESKGTEEDFAQIATKVLTALREQAVIDWRKKAEVQRDMRRAIKRQLRMHYAIPSDRIDSLTATLMDLARVHLDE